MSRTPPTPPSRLPSYVTSSSSVEHAVVTDSLSTSSPTMESRREALTRRRRPFFFAAGRRHASTASTPSVLPDLRHPRRRLRSELLARMGILPLPPRFGSCYRRAPPSAAADMVAAGHSGDHLVHYAAPLLLSASSSS